MVSASAKRQSSHLAFRSNEMPRPKRKRKAAVAQEFRKRKTKRLDRKILHITTASTSKRGRITTRSARSSISKYRRNRSDQCPRGSRRRIDTLGGSCSNGKYRAVTTVICVDGSPMGGSHVSRSEIYLALSRARNKCVALQQRYHMLLCRPLICKTSS